MFSPIYLRLAGNVPPHPPKIGIILNMNTIEFFSIAFMFSPIYLRLEGKEHPPQDKT